MELVLVDNYSTDGTWEILNELQSHYNIQLYRKKCVKSLGWNIAFNKTEGEYTMKRDVDDIFLDRTYYNILINHSNILDNNNILNFELSKREVIEKAGNWALDLNAGDDVEFMARMFKYGVRRLAIPAQLSIDINVARGKKKGLTAINEYRYAGGLKYLKRISENLVNTIRGYGLNYQDLVYFTGFERIALFYGLLFCKVKRCNIYRHFDKFNNLQVAVNSIEYINPEKYNIPKERWLTTLSPHVEERIFQSKIDLLKKIGFKYIYKDINSIVVSYLPIKNIKRASFYSPFGQ